MGRMGAVDTITVRLVGAAVALGVSPDPSVFLEMRVADWIALRAQEHSRGR